MASLSTEALLMAVGAGTLWGVYPPVMKSAMARLDASTVFVTMSVVASAVSLSLFAPKLPGMARALVAAPKDAAVVMVCAVAGPVAARLLFTRAMHKGGNTGAIIAITYSLSIIIGWAVARLWLGQGCVGGWGIAGFCLVITGVVMISIG